jgi:hypothetical protein
MLSMCIACRITKAKIQTHTHSIQLLLLFYYNSSSLSAPQYYIISTLPVLLTFISSFKGDLLFRVQIG